MPSLAYAAVVAVALLTYVSSCASSTPCSAHTNYTLCSEDLSCAWCGMKDVVSPTGTCFDPSEGGTCCAVTNMTFNSFCTPQAAICNTSEMCFITPDPNVYDYQCQASVCCPKSAPTLCGAMCLPPDQQCCDATVGGMCNSTSTCCGSEMTGLACCDAEYSICCAAEDGFDHWCCPKNQQCGTDASCIAGSEEGA